MENEHEEQKIMYFVDTENISNKWTELLPLTPQSQLLLFYTPHSCGLPYSALENLFQFRAQVRTILCFPGTNALDFQLVTELGHQVALQSDTKFVICSNDHGYDPVCKYWTAQGIKVIRMSFPKLGTETKPTAVKKSPDPSQQVRSLVRKIFTPEENQYVEPTVQILMKEGHSNLQKIYQAFIKQFGQKEGLQIYKAVRTQIKQICAVLSGN